MARARVRTGRIGGNQERIDELEYFLEGIGRFLFGDEGEDFRALRRYIPQTRNVSALVDLHRRGIGRDLAEDLRFLHGELEANSRRGTTFQTPVIDQNAAVFRYRRYLGLLERPEVLIEAVEPTRRLEIANLVTRGASRFAPLLSKVNVFAWLGVVGLPSLESELAAPAAAAIALVDDREMAGRGLARLLGAQRPPPGPGLTTYLTTAHELLAEDYRGQLARYAARTQPL